MELLVHFFLNAHARCGTQCRQYRRRNRCNQLHDEFYGFFLCHSWFNFKWLVLACHLEPSLPLSSRATILSFCHFDRPSSHFVISTERSEWRNLMNAPKGASGKPQRCLDYARHDKGGEGALARHDRVGRGRRSEGATAPTFNLPHLGCHGQNRRQCLAARSQDPRCHRCPS